MFREQLARFLDAVDDTFRKFRFAEIARHRFCQCLPERIAALRVNRFIADDGEFMRARRDKNQDAVAVR